MIKSTKTRARVTGAQQAGPDHQVVAVRGGAARYRREPCDGCPWRVDQTGGFPPEAFCHSANTAYDMAQETFGCHESGIGKPAICAGFLLRGAVHNLAVRLALVRGAIDPAAVGDGGHALHDSYRAMAVANGVLPDDPALARCLD
jgi:hypothetical protein